MTSLRTAIIPTKPEYYLLSARYEWDLPNICIWAATGFFFSDNTFFKNIKAYKPATKYERDSAGVPVAASPWFTWHYTPRSLSLNDAVDEFTVILESHAQLELTSKKILIPLSGGLDSRTLVAAVSRNEHLKNYTTAFSYEYHNAAIRETGFANQVARAAGINFRSFTIPEGYLWDKLEKAAKINGCYAEFTHQRQLAVLDQISPAGNIFFLGHWGDVLFDSPTKEANLTLDQQVEIIRKKVVKKGGLELASQLWKHWNLPGEFIAHLNNEIKHYLGEIEIDHPAARIRAFKSLHWAPRWTATNLQSFQHYGQAALPYFNEAMCKFICTVPESLLQGRKIQIEYLKRYAPALARVPWQTYAPYNLNNFKRYHTLPDWPRRLANRLWMELNHCFGKRTVHENWQLQLSGQANNGRLLEFVKGASGFLSFVSEDVFNQTHSGFQRGPSKQYAHPLSMLLTLAALFHFHATPLPDKNAA